MNGILCLLMQFCPFRGQIRRWYSFRRIFDMVYSSRRFSWGMFFAATIDIMYTYAARQRYLFISL